MKKTGIIMALWATIALSMHAQSIDSLKSEVQFSISNLKWKTVKGTFGGMKGDINFNRNHPDKACFDVSINASTVNTKNKKRDKHLKNEDFFEVDTYPTIHFKSTSATKTSNGYETVGQLTMHGITREITIAFTAENNLLKGNFVVDRFDYGIGEKTNTFMVGKEVNIEIICVLSEPVI
jgi:polyisoprenoid-binding protein YceI